MIKNLNLPPDRSVVPTDYRAIAEGRLLALMELEEKYLELEKSVSKVIADCENPDIRRAHTNNQMVEFLEKTRDTLLNKDGEWTYGNAIPTNDEVYDEVCRARDKKNLYVSSNAVNDVMAAVRTMMTERVK